LFGGNGPCRRDYLLGLDMRASDPSRKAKAAHVYSKGRTDRMNAMKMMNAMDSQNRGLNRILNRRSPFVGDGCKVAGNWALSIIYIYNLIRL